MKVIENACFGMWCNVKPCWNSSRRIPYDPLTVANNSQHNHFASLHQNSPFSCEFLVKFPKLLSFSGSQVKRWPSLDPCEVRTWLWPMRMETYGTCQVENMAELGESAAVVRQSLWTGCRCLDFSICFVLCTSWSPLIPWKSHDAQNPTHNWFACSKFSEMLKKSIQIISNPFKSKFLWSLSRPATMIPVPARAGRVGSRFLAGTWGDQVLTSHTCESKSWRISWFLGSLKNALKQLKHDQKIYQ